jgi:quercetin dioxygenase-like cupin family protein
LTERQVADGVPPMLVGGLAVGSDVVFLRTDDFDGQPHPAPREQWVVMLRGTIEVEVSDGGSRRFAPGDLLLVSDTSGSGHVTRATSDTLLSEALFVPIPQAQ